MDTFHVESTLKMHADADDGQYQNDDGGDGDGDDDDDARDISKEGSPHPTLEPSHPTFKKSRERHETKVGRQR